MCRPRDDCRFEFEQNVSFLVQNLMTSRLPFSNVQDHIETTVQAYLKAKPPSHLGDLEHDSLVVCALACHAADLGSNLAHRDDFFY